jgi:hypothetical protein
MIGIRQDDEIKVELSYDAGPSTFVSRADPKLESN